METIAPGLVSLNGTDLKLEALRAEHAEELRAVNEQLKASKAETLQLQQQVHQYYAAYEQERSAGSRLAMTCQSLQNDVLDRSRQLELFKPGGRAKVSVSVAQAVQLKASSTARLAMIAAVAFTIRPLGLVIHEATLRWDGYSLRLFMPQRRTETGNYVDVVTLLGDNERDFLSFGVFDSLRGYLHQTHNQTVEQFGSGSGVQLPELLWPEHLRNIKHNFVYCLRRAEALPFAHHFRLISSDYEEERSTVMNEIAAAKAANTANDANLRRPRVIGAHGFLPDAHQRSDTYKQTF
jgi:DNA-binding cell septation regulator SpoVG